MIYYYLITAILALISFVILVFSFESKKTNYYFLVILLILALSNAGYLAIALSRNVDEAILANKLCYLGGCFVPVVLFFLVSELCNLSLSRVVKGLFFAYSGIVYGMVLSTGYNGIYYKETWLEEYGGVSVLGNVYGVGHHFFNVILYGYLILQMFFLVYSFVRKKSVSRKNLYALFLMGAATITLFAVGKMLNLRIEVIPLVYVINGWIILYMYRRGVIYSINEGLAGSLGAQEVYGYIMFDKHSNYLGCNEMALRIFPQFSECTVDCPIRNIGGLEKPTEWVYVYKDSGQENFTYEENNRHYECRITPMLHRNRVCGFMVEMREDTDKWQYMQLLSKHNAELESFQETLEIKVQEQTRELRIQQNKIQEQYVQTVTSLSEAVDAKDRYTSGHSKRVAEYAELIAERMGKSAEEREKIYYAGLLHDVGKIRIPAEIINKPGRLTEEEFNIIKLHPVTGHHILRGISDNDYVALGAKYHHERYDGKGYPDGLAGDEIPEVARILGVADSYDAMASNRSYRDALPQEVVRAEIEKGRGTQFDPEIADVMLQMMEEDREYTMRQSDPKKRVLVVDDDGTSYETIAEIMQEETNYEIVSAQGSRRVTELLEEQQPNLILLDTEMQDAQSLEVMAQIRESCDVPVVLLTGSNRKELLVYNLMYGCEDYIRKPYFPLLVREVIHNMTK